MTERETIITQVGRMSSGATSQVPTSVSIVGAGAIASALAHSCIVAGVKVSAIASRTASRAKALADQFGGAVEVVPIGEIVDQAPVVLVAVSDSSIETVASEIAEGLVTPARTIVAHTSGFRDIEALTPLAGRARIGTMHPLAAVARTPVPPTRTPDEWRATFAGGAFAVEGEDDVRLVLHALAHTLGAHPFDIRAEDKAAYHLGASMLAAFSASLAQLAWDSMRAAGASEEVASRGVGHLLQTVGRNVAEAERPLMVSTGPVARGDVDGVRRQIRAAQLLSPAAVSLYVAQARHAIALAHEAGKVNDSTARAMLDALTEMTA